MICLPNPYSNQMVVTVNKHLVMTLDEQYAIVNALAFYHSYHTDSLDADLTEQYKIAYKEDSYGGDFIDQLATKIANIH